MQERSIGGFCSANNSSMCFPAAAATLCDGDAFEWPCINESTAEGKDVHELLDKNGTANSSGWGTLLLDLELWQTLAAFNGNFARTTNTEPEGVVVARNHYWLSDSPATLIAPSSLDNSSSRNGIESRDRLIPRGNIGDHSGKSEVLSNAANNASCNNSHSGPTKAPSYADLWALKMEDSKSIPQISLRVNGSATTRTCATPSRLSTSDSLVLDRNPSNHEAGVTFVHLTVDVAHPGPGDGTQPSAIYVCLALLQESNSSAVFDAKSDSNQTREPVLPVFWRDNCATVLPATYQRFTGWTRGKRSAVKASSDYLDTSKARTFNHFSADAESISQSIKDTAESPARWLVEVSCWNCNTVVVALSHE